MKKKNHDNDEENKYGEFDEDIQNTYQKRISA